MHVFEFLGPMEPIVTVMVSSPCILIRGPVESSSGVVGWASVFFDWETDYALEQGSEKYQKQA